MDIEAASEIVGDLNPDLSEQMVLEPEDTAHALPIQELNVHVQALIKEIEPFPGTEEKLNKIIAFMESALAQEGIPHFKSFWESRNLCLSLFKEHIPPSSRTVLWEKYSALSKEARRLKELLNEQSAFAEEQIDIAIKALEEDLKQSSQIESDKLEALPLDCEALKAHFALYNRFQHELNLLNVYASKINSLRKELIKTEMRVRKKNKFFQRLSSAGDNVFPRRKELIKEISQQFTHDVEAFIKTHFSRTDFQKESPFILREEIKRLQNIAKILTLNAQSFTYTRTRLSECWDKLKDLDKERRHQRAEKKLILLKNSEAVEKKISDLSEELTSKTVPTYEALEKLDSIISFMRSVELGREEISKLRQEITKIRQPIQDKIVQEAALREDQERERAKLKQQRFLELREEVEALIKAAKTYEVEQLIEVKNNLQIKISQSSLIKSEKEFLEKLLKPIKEMIVEKKETGLLLLSSNEPNNLSQLQEALIQRRTLREEVKSQIETLRKAHGASGLDFVKAMEIQTQLNEEKEHLQKMNQAIKEIEARLRVLNVA